MTKEEWEQAGKTLADFYSIVYLKADGYEVALTLKRVSTYKNAIMIYVGGVFKGKWLTEDCEERRRFCRRSERSLLSAKEKANFKKLSKKMQKEQMERYHNFTYNVYSSGWTSFGALKRHLIANNESIDLVKIV